MLTPQQDAFGQAMLAYLKNNEGQEIIERFDGLIETSGGPKNYFSTYDEWSDHNKKALKFAHGRILDIGCGAGRIALYLQEKGHEVLGIDNSPLAIEVCRRRGLANARVCSITDLTWRTGIFDTVIMFGNNFGLFGNFKRARWLLRRFRRMTSPGGLILAESLDPYQTDKLYHLEYQAANRAAGRMSGQIRLRARYLNYKTPWIDYLMVSQKEMTEILLGTGWQVREFINSEVNHYVAVIEKTE
jgi:SAM-dependent methyltransferase